MPNVLYEYNILINILIARFPGLKCHLQGSWTIEYISLKQHWYKYKNFISFKIERFPINTVVSLFRSIPIMHL